MMHKIISLQAPLFIHALHQITGSNIFLVNSLIGYGEEGNLYLGIIKGLLPTESNCTFVIKAHLELSERSDSSDTDESSDDRPDPKITIVVYRALLNIPTHPGLNLPIAFSENDFPKTILDQLEQPRDDDYSVPDEIKPKIAFFTVYPRMADSINHGPKPDWVIRIPDLKASIRHLFSGLEHLNSYGILYSDFATRNILYSPIEGLQLCDFGCSDVRGTLEINDNQKYSQKKALNDFLFEHIANHILKMHTNFPLPNINKTSSNSVLKRKLTPYIFLQDPIATKLMDAISVLVEYPLSQNNKTYADTLLSLAEDLRIISMETSLKIKCD